MKVEFKAVDIEGFLSIGKATVDLSNQHTVYVEGVNESPGSPESNGSGKSTIFEAIVYALTGATLRGTRDVVNRYYSEKFCAVTLDLEVDGIDYKITRTKDHPDLGNNLVIIRDGEDISGGKLRRSEEILKNELKTLTTSFISNVIILGQGLPNKFTDLGPTARRDKLEELSQTADYVDEMKNRIGKYSMACNEQLDDLNESVSKISTHVSSCEAVISTSVREIENIHTEEAKRMKASSYDLDSMKKSFSDLGGKMQSYRDQKEMALAKVQEYKTKVLSAENQMKLNTGNIDKLSRDMASLKTSECPTCHQFIQSPEAIQDLKDKLQSQITNLEANSSQLYRETETDRNTLSMLESKLKSYNDKYEEISSEYMRLHAAITEAETRGKSDQDRIQKLTEEIDTLKKEIDSSQEELSAVNKVVSDFTLRKDIAQFLEKRASKEFRNYLLAGVVEFLNSKLSYYGEALFGVDRLKLELTENQIFIQYEGRPYENLSGGERQRADLAMQFSLRDMLITTLGFNCNLLVIDEGFDNLDASGVESLVKVINNMTLIESIFVISHHTLSIPFDSVLTVNKGSDNVSYVEKR